MRHVVVALTVLLAYLTAGCSPAASPAPSTTPGPNDLAHARCATAIEVGIPMVSIASGEPVIAAAYEVTGQQMSRYFVSELGQSEGGNGAGWWNNLEAVVDMCVVDGDFDTQTPGPPGHETRANRVLVVIDPFEAFAWAFCFVDADVCTITTTDPTTIALG